MKSHKNKFSLFLFVAIFIAFSSCKKTAPNIFNMFDVTLELHQTTPYSLTEEQTLNEGDSIHFNFTITSPTKEMHQVALFQLGSALPNLRITLDPSQAHSYTGIIRGVAGQNGFGSLKNGVNTFRIWAYDRQGIYLGDGYKTITIHVNNEIKHIVNRRVYFPDVDSANGSAHSYLSLLTGETFNYQTGAANSDKIDLGIYRTSTSGTNVVRFYSLSASPLPFNAFNISTWANKRATKFANPQNGQNSNFLRQYTSEDRLGSYVRGRNPNLAATTSNANVNQVIPFLTPEGNYGLLLINVVSNSGSKPYIDVSIKYVL